MCSNNKWKPSGHKQFTKKGQIIPGEHCNQERQALEEFMIFILGLQHKILFIIDPVGWKKKVNS